MSLARLSSKTASRVTNSCTTISYHQHISANNTQQHTSKHATAHIKILARARANEHDSKNATTTRQRAPAHIQCLARARAYLMLTRRRRWRRQRRTDRRTMITSSRSIIFNHVHLKLHGTDARARLPSSRTLYFRTH